MAQNSTFTLHIAIFATTYSSHLCQLFDLAKAITRKGHHVSFVSTVSGLKAIKVDPSSPNHSNLDLVPLPGEDISNLQEQFGNFLRQTTQDVDWVVFDLSTFWVPEISEKLGIQSAYITPTSAISNAFLWPAISGPDVPNIHQLMPQRDGPVMVYSHEEAYRALDHLLLRDGQNLPLYHRIHKAITMCNVVALPCYHELDGELPLHLEKICQKNVFSCGHLPQTASSALSDTSTSSAVTREWLDKRNLHSVVYVAIETEIFINPVQVVAIADGLERSRLPFIWVIGSPQGGETLMLPNGFEEKTCNNGIVCRNWVPHADILSHPSVGGFLTNGNWNSSIEALNCGIPLILAPLSTVDVPNTHLLTDKRFGYEVMRNPHFKVFLGDDVDRALKHVMVDQGGEEVRQRAKAMKGVFSSLQDPYLLFFLHSLDKIKKGEKLCDFDRCVICKSQRKIAGTSEVLEHSEDET